MLIVLSSAHAQTDNLYHSFGAAGASDGLFPRGGAATDGTSLYGTTSAGGNGDGTLYEINCNGTGYQVIYSFGSIAGDGNDPESTPCLSSGTIYGTASEGGTNGGGILYSIGTNGSNYQILYNFEATGSDGFLPDGDLLLSGTELYGTTSAGGSHGDGTLYSIGVDGGNYQVLYNFGATGTDAKQPEGDLVLQGSAIYGATAYGGNNGDGAIYTIGTGATGYHLLYSFGATGTDGVQPLAGLNLQGSTLYGTTVLGGTNNLGTVFSINTAGSGYTVRYRFGAGGAGDASNPASSLVAVGSFLYGTAQSGGTNAAGAIYEVALAGTGYGVLYSFAGGEDDGAVPLGSLALTGSTIYGITTIGGSGPDLDGDGTVFSYLDATGEKPAVTTLPPTELSATSALLAGSAKPNGFYTTAWFEYGLTGTYGFETPAAVITGSSATMAISGTARGLKLHTLYHYRALAQNSNGF